MRIIYDKNRMRVPIKTWCMNPEIGALDQAEMLANHPAIVNWVALMPDTHQGYGMPVGGVVCFENAISPNVVGVDIGCGMCSIATGITLDQFESNKSTIMSQIRGNIPVGFKHREKSSINKFMEMKLSGLLDRHQDGSDFISRVFEETGRDLFNDMRTQVCTLGGGNHFVEIQKDGSDNIWVMLHSGSRNVGKQVADVYNRLAIELNQKWKTPLPNRDLAFFPLDTEQGQEYFKAMNFAQDFALQNRRCMIQVIIDAFEAAGFQQNIDEIINIHHNYADIENHFGRKCIVHRKGATLARDGTIGIIPGSMGTNSYIVKGKGNPDSFHSCSHGAGRTMSRTEAKRTITIEAFSESMKDVDFRVSEGTIDESPLAYKDIHTVMAEQDDLIEVLVELSPVLPIKAENRKGE